MKRHKESSLMAIMFWMMFFLILLGWLPIIGAFIAGVIGGKKAKSVPRAIVASIIPALIFLIVFTVKLVRKPLIVAITGHGGLFLLLVVTGPFLLGAVLGGLFSARLTKWAMSAKR